MIAFAKFPVLVTLGGAAATTLVLAMGIALASPQLPAGDGTSTVTIAAGTSQVPADSVTLGALSDFATNGTGSSSAQSPEPGANPFANAFADDEANKSGEPDPLGSGAATSATEPSAETSTTSSSDNANSPQPHAGRTLELYQGRVMAASEVHIEQALAASTEFDFFQSTLAEIVDTLSQRHHINIQIDQAAIEGDGLDPTQRFDMLIKGVAFDEALELLLKKMGLTYFVDRSVLVITTPTATLENPQAKFYRLPEGTSPDQVEKLIQMGVNPSSWAEAGGSGVIVTLNSGMMISTTYETHRKITRLLQQYEKLLEQ